MMINEERRRAVQTLAELIKDIRVAMLTTAGEDGVLRGRPMATVRTNFDGDLWFFSNASSPKVRDIEERPHVHLSYAAPEQQRYVTISGTAEVVRDQRKLEALWSREYEGWIPGDAEQTDLVLLKVTVNEAEYWDARQGAMVQVAGFFRSMLTGERSTAGEHERIEWHDGVVEKRTLATAYQSGEDQSAPQAPRAGTSEKRPLETLGPGAGI